MTQQADALGVNGHAEGQAPGPRVSPALASGIRPVPELWKLPLPDPPITPHPSPAPSPGPAPTSSAHPVDRLLPGQQMTTGDRLVPSDRKTSLVMQADGNLVLYRSDNGVALWASHTSGRPVNRAVMQKDGNLVCYDAAGHAYWATGTNGHQGAWVVLQDDGNLVVYGPDNRPLWASNTVHNWSPMAYETDDQHVGTGEWMNSVASMASTGLISGRTRIWCTKDFAGFHGSVFPVLLDGDAKTIWPENPQIAKHQYGVDGSSIPFSTSDRTVFWTNQVPAATIAQAKSLALIQFLDPKNMLLTDLNILGKVVSEVSAIITAIEGAA